MSRPRAVSRRSAGWRSARRLRPALLSVLRPFSWCLLEIDDDAGEARTIRADGSPGHGVTADRDVQRAMLRVGKSNEVTLCKAEDVARPDDRGLELQRDGHRNGVKLHANRIAGGAHVEAELTGAVRERIEWEGEGRAG